VAEVVWHKTQQTTFLPDGSVEFRVRVSGLREISWWILGYGDQAEVLKPAALRNLVADRAKNMAAVYNGKYE
jgi:proteasome accessory factor B